jgi:hypothetical protein
MYPSSSSAEERAVKWLIDEDLNTSVDDKMAMRQRFALSTVWFLQTPTPFGTDGHRETWTTRIDECKWLDVLCVDRGRVTALLLDEENVQGQIPDDLGLLTDLTNLQLSDNYISGTIPSSLAALTALTSLFLYYSVFNGTIPSSFGKLTNLVSLDLSRNFLSGSIPSFLGALTAQTSLRLYDN